MYMKIKQYVGLAIKVNKHSNYTISKSIESDGRKVVSMQGIDRIDTFTFVY